MFMSIPRNLVDLDTIISHDEEIVCANATIVCKKDGEFSCWYNNDKPILMWVEDSSDEE